MATVDERVIAYLTKILEHMEYIRKLENGEIPLEELSLDQLGNFKYDDGVVRGFRCKPTEALEIFNNPDKYTEKKHKALILYFRKCVG